MKILEKLEDYHVHHPLLALIPVFIGILASFILGLPYGGIMGAFFGTGFYYGREITHASYPPGSGVWYRGFQFKNWSRDNHLDFWPVLISTFTVACIVEFIII